MIKKHVFLIGLLSLGVFTSCGAGKDKTEQSTIDEFPKELLNIPIGINVEHSLDTVYATINTKDPEKRGKYQMQFSTSVSTSSQMLIVTEFSAFLLEDGKWVMRTIYDRAFNNEEFEKWYNCPNGILKVNETYTDYDNWLGKGDNLSGKVMNAILYVKGVDTCDVEYIGYKSIVGIFDLDITPKELSIESSKSPSLTMDQVIDTVWYCQKVQAYNEYVINNSGDRKLTIIEQGTKQVDFKEYYEIAVVEDNGSALFKHFIFYVDLDAGEILFYDTENETIIDFEEWKEQ
jgi:hypothetical protein